jgi:hypothetical protein
MKETVMCPKQCVRNVNSSVFVVVVVVVVGVRGKPRM